MIAFALRSRPRPSRSDLRRGALAGLAWGAALTLGLTAMTAWNCGGVCPLEVAENAGLSIAAGLVGIGPVVAFGGRAP